jgi:hypothetical protein
MTTTIEAIVGGTTYSLTDEDPFWVESVNPGMAPGHLLESRGAEQHGATIEGFRLDPRNLELVIGFQGTDTELFTARATLLRIFQRRAEPVLLRFTLDDDSVYQIDGHLANGLQFARDGRDHDNMRCAVILRCGDPSFYDPTAVALTFTLGGGSGSFTVPLTVPVAVGASTIDASLAVEYDGTWEAAPHLIRITGPITEFVLTNETNGDAIQARAGVSIAAGHYVDIDTRYGSVGVTLDGATDWIANLDDADDLTTFRLDEDPDAPGGINVLTVTGSGVTSATQVDVSYYTRYLGF